eukprot:4686296-Alexandrium_andersonii.AAC.1
MSASLVGSEMCIRDRLPPARHGRLGTQVARAYQLAAPPGLLAGPIPRPVSYTHLTLPTICSV